MAAAWFSSVISSMFLISRASSITCWPSTSLMPALLQLEPHAGLDRGRRRPACPATPASLQQARDLLGVPLHQARRRRHGAAHAEHAGAEVLRRQPVAIEPVMHGGRAEVPDDRILVAGQQREAAELVALPLADLGAGEVADVVDVEEQQRAELRVLRAPAWRGRGGSGAGGGNRRASRSRRWCGRAPAARGPSANSDRAPAGHRARSQPWARSSACSWALSSMARTRAVSPRRRAFAPRCTLPRSAGSCQSSAGAPLPDDAHQSRRWSRPQLLRCGAPAATPERASAPGSPALAPISCDLRTG